MQRKGEKRIHVKEEELQFIMDFIQNEQATHSACVSEKIRKRRQ